MTHGEGAQTMADTGTFPSLKKSSGPTPSPTRPPSPNKKTNDYFGGQNVNEVLSAAAQRPTEKFQYLPYNPYAQTAYGDEVSKAYCGDITLEKALENYRTSSPSEASSRATTSPSSDATDLLPVHPALTNNQNLQPPLPFRLAAQSPKAGMPQCPHFPPCPHLT